MAQSLSRFVAVVRDWRGNENVVTGKVIASLVMTREGNSTGIIQSRFLTREYGGSKTYYVSVGEKLGCVHTAFIGFMGEYATRVLRFTVNRG